MFLLNLLAGFITSKYLDVRSVGLPAPSLTHGTWSLEPGAWEHALTSWHEVPPVCQVELISERTSVTARASESAHGNQYSIQCVVSIQ